MMDYPGPIRPFFLVVVPNMFGHSKDIREYYISICVSIDNRRKSERDFKAERKLLLKTCLS